MNGITPLPAGNHGTSYRYKDGCRCPHCTEAHRVDEHRRRAGIPGRPIGHPRADDPPIDQAVAPVWVLLNFPVAVVNRRVWPDDQIAIRAAFKDKT